MSDTSNSGLSDYLQTFGIQYDNPPNVTPALLAFLRGLNTNWDTAGDALKRASDRINQATIDADSDITRTAGRTTKNITADLVRRGVLSSGEANTRYTNQAQDVAVSRRDLQRSKATSLDDAQQAYQQTANTTRMQALDRVIATEQDQATQAAQSAAQADNYQKQLDLLNTQAQQEAAARADYIKQLTGAFGQAGAAGFAP